MRRVFAVVIRILSALSRCDTRVGYVLLVVALGLSASTRTACAKEIEFEWEGATITIDVPHAGPEGDLISPEPPAIPEFGPPSIFSAPLPSGSGARALGQGGAFTAVADDATAASWNPAGLTHLERAEASCVARFSHETDNHVSTSDDFLVGRDSFQSMSVNYLSAVWPFRAFRRNWVFSVNYQEAYDFTRRFTGELRQHSLETTRESKSEKFTTTTSQTEWHDNRGADGQGDLWELDLETTSDTTTETDIRQVLTSETLSTLDFRQSGIVDAFSPAFAGELTPRLSAGGAVNFYQVSPLRGQPIRSATKATYSGTSVSESTITTEQTTESATDVGGTVHWFLNWPLPWDPPSEVFTTPVTPGELEHDPFTDTTTARRRDATAFDGEYEETSLYEQFRGVNATFGLLWTLSRFLDVGCAVDLPWTATAIQTKHVRHKVTTYDEARTTVLNVSETEKTESKQIALSFPLYCAVGALLRWNNRFHSALDVSRTQWSDFAFQAEGEERVNPLDGSPYGQNPVADCWTVCCGHEYLWVLRATEIPFRGGVIWEQRPAVEAPDQYWGVSLGSGISIGREPGRLIIDFAYVCTWGDDVMGSLVPGQQGLRTDVLKQQGYVSGIVHF